VDLSRYTGNQVTLQFEYVTDLAVNGDGFVIDDISIEAIQYFTDFELDTGGWESRGFVRVKNRLPQNFGYTALSSFVLEDQENVISIGGLEINQILDPADQDFQPVIVINGLTRTTRIPAEYSIRVTLLESN
jgi:bacillopeptidase F (M6 metalloprotease family)